MPLKLAAKKDLRKNIKRHVRNLSIRKNIKTVIKEFKKIIETGDEQAKKEALRKIYVSLDKAAAKKVIHPNKAARKKSRMAALMNKKPVPAKKV
jgi:small subunit ribosomal protein S20